MTDRATLYTRLQKYGNRRSETVSKVIIKKFEQADYPMLTVTFNNDLGFFNHTEFAEALNVDTFFTKTYTSQDKGTVENRNGQIRRIFPKS
jgi:IS30 family transposase